MAAQLLVFVHGWSVTSTATYGKLPARLKREAARKNGPALDVRHIHLAEYVSFRDEVRIADIARAFDSALADVIAADGGRRRCVCITHSTGAPVVREWLDRFVIRTEALDRCPISHLIMLAPANFGSALAQLGKSRLGAIKAWFDGVEPGQGVLDWLELGSSDSCALNLRWVHDYPALTLTERKKPIFPFVLSGDSIDRKLYDHLNTYTGETGSDGVVRLAAANLDTTHVVLRQPASRAGEALPSARKRLRTLKLDSVARSARTAFAIIPGKSHSGTRKGIMASVPDDDTDDATVSAILECLAVRTHDDYAALCEHFAERNAAHQAVDKRLETEHVPVLPDREYIIDPCTMVIVRLFDHDGRQVPDVDISLTAGPDDDPDQLPRGFMIDRQANRRRDGTVTFYLNHAVLAGCPAIKRADGSVARPALVPRPPYGIRLDPRHRDRFVAYWQAMLDTAVHELLDLVHPNQTTLVDIHLSRVVHRGILGFTTRLAPPQDFKHVEPGGVA